MLGLPTNLATTPQEKNSTGTQEIIIRQAVMDALTYIRGYETETFRMLSKGIRENVDRAAAILAIQKIPVAYWPRDEVTPLLQSLVVYLRQLPASDRTTPIAVNAFELCDSLSTMLPADSAKKTRREISELGVRVIRIGTVIEQMRFDLDQIAVQAGKPVEILFQNYDMMPHNFVITQPGALEEIGLLAEATVTHADTVHRGYVPVSSKIILSSRLLQPRETEKIHFTAPAQAGVYPFVCTYPGHWRRMYGALYVVDNLDEYLASPESYLASHPLRIIDNLLSSSRPRTEWRFDDLASSIAQLAPGRSFSNGKQLFQIAACASCHKINGVGKDFGPDLAKLEPRQSPVDLLRNIIDPTSKISDKYNAYVFELENGQVTTGLIVEETPQVLKIVENPLAGTEPRTVKKSEIASRQKSSVSFMPKGLLDKLTREEILDLVTYITAGGDANHALFKGHHSNKHDEQVGPQH
jgi:putative heme-binding domain-containing protein